MNSEVGKGTEHVQGDEAKQPESPARRGRRVTPTEQAAAREALQKLEAQKKAAAPGREKTEERLPLEAKGVVTSEQAGQKEQQTDDKDREVRGSERGGVRGRRVNAEAQAEAREALEKLEAEKKAMEEATAREREEKEKRERLAAERATQQAEEAQVSVGPLLDTAGREGAVREMTDEQYYREYMRLNVRIDELRAAQARGELTDTTELGTLTSELKQITDTIGSRSVALRGLLNAELQIKNALGQNTRISERDNPWAAHVRRLASRDNPPGFLRDQATAILWHIYHHNQRINAASQVDVQTAAPAQRPNVQEARATARATDGRRRVHRRTQRGDGRDQAGEPRTADTRRKVLGIPLPKFTPPWVRRNEGQAADARGRGEGIGVDATDSSATEEPLTIDEALQQHGDMLARLRKTQDGSDPASKDPDFWRQLNNDAYALARRVGVDEHTYSNIIYSFDKDKDLGEYGDGFLTPIVEQAVRLQRANKQTAAEFIQKVTGGKLTNIIERSNQTIDQLTNAEAVRQLLDKLDTRDFDDRVDGVVFTAAINTVAPGLLDIHQMNVDSYSIDVHYHDWDGDLKVRKEEIIAYEENGNRELAQLMKDELDALKEKVELAKTKTIVLPENFRDLPADEFITLYRQGFSTDNPEGNSTRRLLTQDLETRTGFPMQELEELGGDLRYELRHATHYSTEHYKKFTTYRDKLAGQIDAITDPTLRDLVRTRLIGQVTEQLQRIDEKRATAREEMLQELGGLSDNDFAVKYEEERDGRFWRNYMNTIPFRREILAEEVQRRTGFPAAQMEDLAEEIRQSQRYGSESVDVTAFYEKARDLHGKLQGINDPELERLKAVLSNHLREVVEDPLAELEARASVEDNKRDEDEAIPPA